MRSFLLVVSVIALVAQVFAQTQSQPCVPPTTPPQTACAVLNTSLVPQCQPYLTYTSVLTTPATPIPVLIGIAEAQLGQLTQIPPTCGVPLTEMICKLIFQECVEIPLGGPITLALPKTPCKEVCRRANTACAQIFSSAGQVAQDCDALGPTCSPLFVEENTTLVLAPPPVPPIVLPCQPPVAPVTPPTFYCEKFKGEPSTCKPYIDYDLSFSLFFDQKTAAATATQSLASLASVPDACRLSAEEFICRNIFRKCYVAEDPALPTPFYYGEAVCRSGCNQFNVQCGELFGLQGANLTNCTEYNVQLQNDQYPKDHSTYHYGLTTIEVPCKSSDLTKKQTPPMFSCTKWQGEPKQCKPYLSKDGKDPEIFVIDPFQLEARVNLTTTFIAMLQELPKTCRKYATEMICRTLLQECKTFNDDDLPTTYYVGKPGCKKICKQVRGCAKELKRIGIPPPDCNEDDALVSGKVYPSSKNKLLIPGHDYSVSCINTIYNKDDNNDHKRRVVRDVEGEESVDDNEHEFVFDESQEEEDDEEDELIDPREAREALQKTIIQLYGESHPAAKIGFHVDHSIEEMVRAISEKLVRRIHL
eukprot:TRINITY_DN3309_c0_g1_i1.p1 TRINITY_DN3309_c0_g1~~TRINITY_DN3309_c0_g1_i1.p1  ORF type:complete len:588 (-),score=135.76 TRINITY_DN3309_c0_g1_i1:119-1882(-)